jgi:beta-lactamase regulating signal transducer with metallopeptidase domain
MMFSTVARASIDGAIAVAIVWILCRWLPLSSSARTLLWWAAAARFVLGLVWTSPIAIPILPADAPADAFAVERGAASGTVVRSSEDHARNVEAARDARARWSGALAAMWTGGFIVFAGGAAWRWRRIRDVVRRSTSAVPGIHAMTADLVRRLGSARVPDVRTTDEVLSPLVLGLMRPIVLLPERRFAALTERQQQLALCHELAHLKRADLWFGCIPALAERAFFFHPLAHLATREYAFWREAACDAAVLDALDAAPQEYGTLLLRLGISAPQSRLAAAGASWSFSNLKRRIVMLGDPSTRSWTARFLTAGAFTLSAAAMVPLELTARLSPPAGPPPYDSPRALSSVATDDLLTAPARASLGISEQENERKEQEGDAITYALFLGDRNMMSGARADIARARTFRRPGESLLWFRMAGREYVVRDPELLRQVWSVWQPVSTIGDLQGQIGEEQGALGEKQGQIGEKQGEIGERQGEIGERQGELAEKMAQIAEREARVRSDAERQIVEGERGRIDVQSRELDRLMAELDAKMRELDKPMRELDDQMRALDVKMRELDGRMREANARAEAEMRRLFERAVATGTAQVVK